MPDTTRTRRVAALARATRAAVLLPTLFALLIRLLHNPQAAGFSVFGVFAHLVMTSYGAPRRQRILQALNVTFAGAAMIAWGTAVSTHLWLAVLSAAMVAFATRSAAPRHSLPASIHTVVLLAFMLAVTAQAGTEQILPRLAGWLLSGAIAVPVLFLTWISLIPPRPAVQNSFASPTLSHPFAGPPRAAIAMASAVFLAAVFRIGHGFWIILGILPVLHAADIGHGASLPHTFLKQQAGTLTGFLVSAALVFLIGDHHLFYWAAIAPSTFLAAYLAGTGTLLSVQAAFTFFIVVLLNLVVPVEYSAGLERLTGIAIGGCISLLTGMLYAPYRRRLC